MKVTIILATCKLCGLKIIGKTQEDCRDKLKNHIDTDCEGAKTLKEWDKQGLLEDMLKLIKLEALDKDLKKLIKQYGLNEVKQGIVFIEQNGDLNNAC